MKKSGRKERKAGEVRPRHRAFLPLCFILKCPPGPKSIGCARAYPRDHWKVHDAWCPGHDQLQADLAAAEEAGIGISDIDKKMVRRPKVK